MRGCSCVAACSSTRQRRRAPPLPASARPGGRSSRTAASSRQRGPAPRAPRLAPPCGASPGPRAPHRRSSPGSGPRRLSEATSEALPWLRAEALRVSLDRRSGPGAPSRAGEGGLGWAGAPDPAQLSAAASSSCADGSRRRSLDRLRSPRGSTGRFFRRSRRGQPSPPGPSHRTLIANRRLPSPALAASPRRRPNPRRRCDLTRDLAAISRQLFRLVYD